MNKTIGLFWIFIGIYMVIFEKQLRKKVPINSGRRWEVFPYVMRGAGGPGASVAAAWVI